MLHTKFQASKPSGSEEEDLLIFLYVFLWLKLGTPGQRPSWTLGPSFEQTWYRCTRQCYIPNFKHLGHVVLKKKIFQYISVHFHGSNLGPLARGHLGSWDLGLNKLGKGPPSNATNQISSTWAKQFWRRRFLSIFHFWTQDPPPQGHFGAKGHHLNKLGRGPLSNATYQILRP